MPDKLDATKKAVLRALKLFCLGLVLQGTRAAATFFFFVQCSTQLWYTCDEMLTVWIFFLLLRYAGGFFHGVRSLTFGIDLQEIRLMGILQVYEMLRFVIYAICFVY